MTQMQKLVDQVDRAQGIHGRIAREAWPDGARMRCRTCRRSWVAAPDELAGYLAAGWPLCCGRAVVVGE